MKSRLQAVQNHLGDDDVHIWVADLRRHPCLRDEGAWRNVLTPDEHARYERRTIPAVRNEYLVARSLVRAMLASYTGFELSAWRFRHNAHGRPEIDEPVGARDLRFNVSHTSGAVVCALARKRDVGIDIEDPTRGCAAMDLADRFFSTHEADALRALNDPERRKLFFEMWTLKEAYVKGQGKGLSISLKKFWFIKEATAVRIHIEPELGDDPTTWRFEQFRLESGYQGAVAVRVGKPFNEMAVRFLDAADLGLF